MGVRFSETVMCAVVLLGLVSAAQADPAARGIDAARRGVISREALTTLGLKSGEITPLDVRAEGWAPTEVLLPLDGTVVLARLEPASVLAPHFVLRAQVADGSYITLPRPEERTYRGTIDEEPGTTIAASISERGLEARIEHADGAVWWVEPIADRLRGGAREDHVIYPSGASIAAPGVCGVSLEMEALSAGPEGGAAEGSGGEERGLGPGQCGGTCIADLAIDCDFTFFTARGSVENVTSRVMSVINLANAQYVSQTDILHRIVTIIVRTAEPDPYQGPDINQLLLQVRAHWLFEQAAVDRDLVQLFTNETTGSTIGIAYLSAVCSRGLGYSVVRSDCCGSLNCAADLTAHELGHNWSASHCMCTGSTMNPFITCSLTFRNNPDPANVSEVQIRSFRNALSSVCLSPLEGGVAALPIIDHFDAGTVIDTAVWTGIDTGTTISTAGLNEPSAPNSLNLKGASQLRSAEVDARLFSNITVNFSSQAGGSANPPEAGENLVVEYRNDDGEWISVLTVNAPGSAQNQFMPRSVVLPAAASHARLRIRFRNLSTDTTGDDWFIDNVNIGGQSGLPGSFTLLAPANGASGVGLGPFFDWTEATTALDYRFVLDDDADFSSPSFSELTGGLSSVSTSTGTLAPATRYFWSVRAINPSGETPSTPANATFVTAGNPPGPFGLNSPADDALFDTIGAVIPFAWQASSQANAYSIEIDDDADFGSPELVIEDIESLARSVPAGSVSNGIYNWRIIAQNAIGVRASSESRQFEVLVIVPACPGDADGDLMVGLGDIAQVISEWGTAGPQADLDMDGMVGLSDLAIVIENWGSVCR